MTYFCSILFFVSVILVDKDQVDVLRTLRASVSVEKEALAVELEQTRKSLKLAEETKTMQLAQVSLVSQFSPLILLLTGSTIRSINYCFNKSICRTTASVSENG